MDLLRHGGMAPAVPRRASPLDAGHVPSLVHFTFGHVRQLDAVAAGLLARLAEVELATVRGDERCGELAAEALRLARTQGHVVTVPRLAQLSATVGGRGHDVGVSRHEVATTSEYGVLGVRDIDFSLDRFPPAPDLAALVERHWLVSWSLPPGREASVTLLPHPCVNVVLDRGRIGVHGVGRDRFTYVFRGEGRVFGVKFRPGAFLPFLGRPLSSITDSMLSAEQLWGPAAAELATRMTAACGVDELVALGEAFLRERWPAPDPQVELVGDVVAALLHDRTISRVDDVTERFGITAAHAAAALPALRRRQPEVGAAPLPPPRGRGRARPGNSTARGPRSPPTSATSTRATSSATSPAPSA